METVSTHISIGDWEFTYCVDTEIVSGIDMLTDTCKITLPRLLQWDGKQIALGNDPVFKRMDKVIVRAGYNDKLNTEFIGYVRNIKAGTPVTIECEDSMMLLKQNSIDKKSYKSVNLKQLVADIIPGDIKTVCSDGFDLGKLRITNATPAKVLEELRHKYNVFSYFRNINGEPVLYTGLAYWTDNRKEHTFTFGEDIINGDELQYKVAEDVQLKVRAIGIKSNNEKITVEVGDPSGELRTVHAYNVDDAESLKQFAEAQLKRFKYTGYRNAFRTFGVPSVQKGDIVNIVGNKYYPNTRHLVAKVTKRIGYSIGYKQDIEPRELIANGTE